MSTKTILILAAIALLFGCFVWPGMYEYGTYYGPSGYNSPMRTNRITGKVQINYVGEWMTPFEAYQKALAAQGQ